MIDLGKFFRGNWKFLALLTLALSVVSVAVALLLGREYTKQVNLSITPAPTDLVVRLGQLPVLTPAAAGPLAVSYLQGADLSPLDTSSQFEPVSQQVQVTLQSTDRGALENAAPQVIEPVEDGFQKLHEKNLGNALHTQLLETEVVLEGNRRTLAQVEQQIEQTPPTNPNGGEDGAAIARLEALEAKRVDESIALASQEAKIAEFERAESELPRLSDEVVSVEVASESAVTRSGSSVGRIAFAVLGSFLVALAATAVRAFFARHK